MAYRLYYFFRMLAFLRIHGVALSILVGLLLGFGGSDDLRKKAEQGEAVAQRNLGRKYRQGDGVPRNSTETTKDFAEAVKWWRMAADQGDAEAQFWLGWKYLEGEGVTKDDAEAVKWWRMAERTKDDATSHAGRSNIHGQQGS
jgi:uncharacterized protein